MWDCWMRLDCGIAQFVTMTIGVCLRYDCEIRMNLQHFLNGTVEDENVKRDMNAK